MPRQTCAEAPPSRPEATQRDGRTAGEKEREKRRKGREAHRDRQPKPLRVPRQRF